MERSEVRSYRDLLVWQLAVELAVSCYRQTASFPAVEAYGMTSQIRRAAVSVAANIAEGYGRDGAGSLQQFLKIAQGSLKELETHLIIAGRVRLITDPQRDALLTQCDEIGRMLGGLIRRTAPRLQSPTS